MTVEISSLSLPPNTIPGFVPQESSLIPTNRLRVVPASNIRSDPVRVFEILSSVGEVQQIDFTQTQVDQVVSVTYFDLRAARRAVSDLRGDFKSIEPDYSHDSSATRSVRIKRDANLSLDDTMNALSVYGEIERISFAGSDQLVIEFFDTRGPIAVMTALSSSGNNSSTGAPSTCSSRPAVGGDARRLNYSDPPVCISTLQNPPGNLVASRCESVEFDINIHAIQSGVDTRTTLMVRNIPNKYSQKMLLRLMDLRFKDKYDFFYLYANNSFHLNYRHRCNVGYAFLNFFDAAPIVEFFKAFNDKKWEKFNSEKVCKISYARLQGQEALLDHFKSSSVMQQHKQMRPFFVKSDGLLTNGAPSFVDGSVIESVWSETSQGTNGGGLVSPTLPPLSSLNLATVEGSLYAAVYNDIKQQEI